MHSTDSSTPVPAQAFSHDVAVVGCGVVGLAASLVLANSGFKVLVVGPRPEQFTPTEDQRFDPRVYALSHRSQRLLDKLRVWDKLPSHKVQPVSEMQVWGDGVGAEKGFLRFNAGDTGVESLTWIVEQNSLFDVLLAAIQYQPNVDWINAPVEGLSRERHIWSLVTRDKTVQVPLLIAADGAQSETRRQAGLDFELQDYSAEGVVCTYQVSKPHHGVARQWFDDQRILAMLPLPGPYVSMVWSMPLVHSQAFVKLSPLAQAAQLEAASDGAVSSLYGEIKPCGRTFAYPLRHGVAPHWFGEHVVLMGDAAHVVHPLAGQGLNLGLEDAAELAELLTSRKRLLTAQRLGLTDEQLWRAWERRRKAACTPMHWMTDGLHNLFRIDLPGVGWARNHGMRLVNGLPTLKRWLTQQAMR